MPHPYPKSTGDKGHHFAPISKSEENYDEYEHSPSSSNRSKQDLPNFHETGVLSLLEEEGFPRDSFKQRQVANSDGKRCQAHNPVLQVPCGCKSSSSTITDPQEQLWCSESGTKSGKRMSSHDEYSNGKIGVFSSDAEQVNRDPFRNNQRRTFCSQGCASPPQFIENYHPDVFSQDGKSFVQNLQKISPEQQAYQPFFNESDLMPHQPHFAYSQMHQQWQP